MIKRKLIKQGKGGFTVYLPKRWVDERGLDASSEVGLEEANNALIITAESSKIKRELTIKIKENNEHLVYVHLSHAYRIGVDRIVVNYDDPTTLKNITKIVSRNLVGFEIISSSKNNCVLENVTEPSGDKFPAILGRLFYQVKETHNLILDDFTQNKRNNYEQIHSMRQDFDKYVFFCRRLISKRTVPNINSKLYWELLTFLMHIQHGYYYMYLSYHNNLKEKISKETAGILEEMNSLLDNYHKSFVTKTMEHFSIAMREPKQKIDAKIDKLLNSNISKNKVILAHMKHVTRLLEIGRSPIRAMTYEDSSMNEQDLR